MTTKGTKEHEGYALIFKTFVPVVSLRLRSPVPAALAQAVQAFVFKQNWGCLLRTAPQEEKM
ncbi:MAG: hypothetical protein FJZ86_17790 [Chloroflexi bacterium]|nr:hypothetical protein [Chloroflexota bacterium]